MFVDIYHHALAAFLAFFAIMNPIANTAVFARLAGARSKADQAKVAAKSVIVAFFIVAAFSVLGKTIFHLFGITLPALRVAVGVLVFLIGYHMLHGESSKLHSPNESNKGSPENAAVDAPDISVSPLAVPILAGPGTLATAMNLSASGGWEKISVTIGAFAVLCAVTFICFVLSQRIVAVIGSAGIGIVTRPMGLIMTVIGAQMLIAGISAAFPG